MCTVHFYTHVLLLCESSLHNIIIHHDKHTQYSFDAVLYLFPELLLQSLHSLPESAALRLSLLSDTHNLFLPGRDLPEQSLSLASHPPLPLCLHATQLLS